MDRVFVLTVSGPSAASNGVKAAVRDVVAQLRRSGYDAKSEELLPEDIKTEAAAEVDLLQEKLAASQLKASDLGFELDQARRTIADLTAAVQALTAAAAPPSEPEAPAPSPSTEVPTE